MNTFEKLMKADAKKRVGQFETKTIKSKRLAFLMGEKEPVDITISAVDYDEIEYISEYITDKKGSPVPNKEFKTSLIACAKGIIDPPVSSDEFISYFGATDAKDAVKKVFQGEVAGIAGEIMKLSIPDAGAKDEIKN